jgi:hypothetical protein
MPPGFHHRPVAKRNRGFAKAMRCDATTVEAAMWRLLRHRRLAGFKFHRQVPFQTYILDFVRYERKSSLKSTGASTSNRSGTRKEILFSLGRDSAFSVTGTMTFSCSLSQFWKKSSCTLLMAEADPSPGALRAPSSPTRREGRLRLAARHCR